MEIKEMLLTHNRPYTKRSKTTAIAVHYVGNAGSSAVANRNYFQNTSTSVSSHYIIGLDGEIIRCIPEDEISWCTNQANSYTISIENCHPSSDGIFNNSKVSEYLPYGRYSPFTLLVFKIPLSKV